MLTDAIRQVIGGSDLTRDDARAAMDVIMRGEATPAQVAGYVVALRMKGETVDEIVGSAEAMRAAAITVQVDVDAENLVDTAGTGGDGAGTINISTAAALVAAGAGVRVAKHGNRSVSSSCGSADVLEALGVALIEDPEAQARILDEVGFAFLFAPYQHPAMKHAVEPRRELGVRTIFNVLGPLTNPARATHQVVGVYDDALVEPLARVLGELGARRALVVHGDGGLDELSTVGATKVAEWDGSDVTVYEIEPLDLGLETAALDSLAGGDPQHNAAAIRAIFAGERGPQADIVALNAAAAIYVGEAADGLASGLQRAWQSIDSGAAAERLEALVQASREAAR
ncbi:MAG: anthranilate phosphoribosyltransferase [Acidobacteriota bacterium]|jgi:anthranilate phosphoribosyltransferase